MTITAADAAVAIHELLVGDKLLNRLEVEARIEHVTTPETKTSRPEISGSPAPWADQFAHLVTDIEAGARQHRHALRKHLFGWHGDTGPASTVSSRKALHDLTNLIQLAADRDQDGAHWQDAARDLTNWARQARRILDEQRPGEEPWQRAPRVRTADGRLHKLTDSAGHDLWLKPGWSADPDRASVYCRDGCTDERGQLLSYEPSAWTARVIGDAA